MTAVPVVNALISVRRRSTWRINRGHSATSRGAAQVCADLGIQLSSVLVIARLFRRPLVPTLYPSILVASASRRATSTGVGRDRRGQGERPAGRTTWARRTRAALPGGAAGGPRGPKNGGGAKEGR